jgi:predicted nucleic acid-binding Zn ribbon protein
MGGSRLSEPESLGSIISRGRVRGQKKGKQKLELLAANWEHITGERMARHSEPRRLARGLLSIAADSPAWAAELSMATDRILKRIVLIIGDDSVKKVKVQSRERRSGAGGDSNKARASKEDRGEVELEGKLGEEIMALGDEEMRSALARLVRASKASEQNKRDSG